MNYHRYGVWLARLAMGLGLLLAPTPACAQTYAGTAASTAKNVDFSPELAAVTADLKGQFASGKTNLEQLQTCLANINALIVRHVQDGNREQVARLYLLDAQIYAERLNDKARAGAIWEHVLRTYPGTQAARGAQISLTALINEVPEGLEVGQRFPDFSAADLSGRWLSASAFRGHVTMVAFWATWSGPCRAELPGVIAAYQQYHGQGFEIIGVSLDSDQSSLVSFVQVQGMPWPQYFDGLGWDNKLAKKYDVHSIPMDYLLDRRGIIIGKGLRGQELGKAVAEALEN